MADWFVPCNPKDYNVRDAFSQLGTIDYLQTKSINRVDTVYIYVCAPEKRVAFKCAVDQTNIPGVVIEDNEFVLNEEKFNNTKPRMRLALLESFDDDRLSLSCLRENGYKGNMQSQTRVPAETLAYINSLGLTAR